MRRNRLYTVNRWNKPVFALEGNFFYEGGQSYSLPPLESYLPKNLSEDTYRRLAIGSNGQMLNAFHNYGQSVINNMGKGPLVKNNYPFQNNSMLNTDPGTFFNNGVNTSGANTGKSGAGSKGAGLFSKDAWKKGGSGWAAAGVAANALGSVDTGDPRGMWDTLDPVYHLAGGRESGAGNAMSDAGVGLTQAGLSSGQPWLALAGAGLKIIGGLTNAAFGIKTNKELERSINQGIQENQNFVSNASSFDGIHGPKSTITSGKVYDGGWFTGDEAERKNENLLARALEAKQFADRSVDNNIFNISSDQINDYLANYSAYGGPLDFGGGALGLMQQNRYFDTIDKRSAALANRNASMPTAFTGGARTYADGGLEATFLDSFGTDPIGAAVRYNQALEQRAALEEMRRMEAAKEAEYATMQQRLANLETQNQGLQALMTAQTVPVVPEIPETAPTSSSTPSAATRRPRGNNATWNYVEDQLRKSGKFNDIQIEGIKYNLQRESSLNPDIVGDGGAAFGLAQWHGSRQPKDRSLEGQTKHLIDTLSNFDGKEHWIGKDNYEGFMNARTPEEAHYYIAKGYERPNAGIVAKVKRDSDMSLKRLNAFGGELGTNGTDFTNGLLYVDEGGTHEENPFEGVPMGVDAEGIPNLVEEGETVYNDYVFSDRMMVPDFMYKELGLGGAIKKGGISFADASKKLAKESEQRPNDPLSQAGLEASLSKLAEVQETERMKKQAEEYTGLEYACGGKMGKKYKGPGDQSQVLDRGRRLFGSNPLAFSRWNPYPEEEAASYALMPGINDEATWAKINSLPNSNGTASVPQTANRRTTVSSNGSSNFDFGRGVSTEASSVTPDTMGLGKGVSPTGLLTPSGKPELTDAVKKIAQDRMAIIDNDKEGEWIERNFGYNPYQTWMRYAPVAGLGAMTLTDALGITNRPDYTMANRLEAAAQRAGYAPDVRYNPIGDYMRYTPLDRLFYANQLNGRSLATDRMLMNTSSPNKAANLLANAYNTMLVQGNLWRQGEESNRAQYERTKEFNRRTNMFNSQMGLEAAMANARYHQAAQQMGLSGLGQAAALRDSIDARLGAAKAANLSNFLTSLGNIGRENFALNQINSDRSRQYGVYNNGVSEHKRSSNGKKGSRWFKV